MINDVPKEWRDFIEKVYEIAFGDSAIDRGYDAEEVIVQLKEFEANALKYENGQHIDYSERFLEYISKY